MLRMSRRGSCSLTARRSEHDGPTVAALPQCRRAHRARVRRWCRDRRPAL